MAHHRAELEKYFLQFDEYSGCPILFLLNKQDLPDPLPVDDLMEGMGLFELAEKGQRIQVLPCGSLLPKKDKMFGPKVMLEGLSWLMSGD
jgi:hypothetical protein